MPETAAFSHPFRVAALAARKPTRFDLRPDQAILGAIAEELGISAIRDLRFRGEIVPAGSKDWSLSAQLCANVEQPCIVTLSPVITRIDEAVDRRYLAEMEPPAADELEVPADDSAEPLSEIIDAGAVLLEALALALPQYPRAPGAALGSAQFAEPGTVPLTDEAIKPFANLADLMKKATPKE